MAGLVELDWDIETFRGLIRNVLGANFTIIAGTFLTYARLAGHSRSSSHSSHSSQFDLLALEASDPKCPTIFVNCQYLDIVYSAQSKLPLIHT